MSEVADGTRVRRPEDERARVPAPDRPSLAKCMANSISGCEEAGGIDECAGGLPCKRSVDEMESPLPGGTLDFMVKSELWWQSVPDGGGGGGGGGNGGCDGSGDGGGSGSGGGDGGGGVGGGGGGDDSDIGGGSGANGDDDGKRQSVPGGGGGGSSGGGDNGGSYGSGDGGGSGGGGGSGDGGSNGGGDAGGDGDGEGGGSIRRSNRRRVPSSRRFSGDSLGDAPPPPTAAESTRRPSQPCPSVRARPAPSAARYGSGRRTACGKNVCGYTTGWEDPCESCDQKPSHVGHLLCSACHGSPLLNPGSTPVWKHIGNVADVERAVRLWEAHLAATPGLETIIKPGFRPTTSCLCTRPGCFFRTFKRLGYAEQREQATKCVACATRKSPQWRTPCSELGLFQRWLSTGESRGKCVHESSTILEADSTICNACAAEFRHKGKSWVKAHGPGFTVKTFLLYLRQGSAPRRDKVHELSVFLTQRAMVEILETGQAVHLEDGVEMLVKARADAGLKEVTRRTLVSQTVEMFHHLSDTVTDAFFVCFDGDVVGDDNRTKAQYLMPERFDFLYVAKVLRGEKRLEGEVSRLREAVAYAEQAIARRL